ncbi:putative disease resistance protein RGA1 [Drosera capensis]
MKNSDSVIEFLAGIPMLRGLPISILKRIAEVAVVAKFGNSLNFGDGDENINMNHLESVEHWIENRSVMVVVSGQSDAEKGLERHLKANNCFGMADSAKNTIVRRLERLAPEDSRALFEQTVFANEDKCPSSLEVGVVKIVDKCAGIPLAIRTLGAALGSNKNPRHWESIANSELCNTQQLEKIAPYLLLSFQHLPSFHVKQCFAYRSIYPKDCIISKDDVISLWMAQGLLFREERSNLKTEEVGEIYFNILVNHSFLQREHFVEVPTGIERLALSSDVTANPIECFRWNIGTCELGCLPDAELKAAGGDSFPSWLTRMAVVSDNNGLSTSLDILVVLKFQACRRCELKLS